MNISKINFNRISFGKINVYGQKQEFENATNPFSSKTQVDRFEQSENSDKERKTREGRLKFSGKVDDDILKKLNTDFLANAADLNNGDINLATGNIKALAQTNIGNPFEDDELLNHANCPEMLAVVLKKPKDFERFIQNVSSLNEVVVKHFGERAGFVQTLYQETF
jgi:hypothetical protein